MKYPYEIENDIADYRYRLRSRLVRGSDTSDIRLKLYQLLSIKKYILDHPIQHAQAEIVRPAEQASIANGGKKKKNKTKKR